jgi:hypothetical protein
LATRFVVGLLERQGVVEHEAARPGEAAHLTQLSAVGHERVLEGLESLHGSNYTLVYERQQRDSTRQTLCIYDARPFGLCS